MNHNIVVLDGYAANPGDISWEPLNALGNVTVYDRTAPEDVANRIADADIVLINKVKLTVDVLEQSPKLSYIGVLATGYDIIEMDWCKSHGITVTNIPAYSTASVAQFTFALLLELCHRAGKHDDAVHEGKWTISPDFCFWDAPLTELSGKTFGIIGYGSIGKAVANIAKAFGMNVIVWTRTIPDNYDSDIAFVSKAEVFSKSDVLSLHVPSTQETKEMVNSEVLATMKPTAFLINTARGTLIVPQDLADALKQGIIAGAALDVMYTEPPKASDPLLSAPNCIITPHIAWAPSESRQRLMDIATNNVRQFLAGTPINVVSK